MTPKNAFELTGRGILIAHDRIYEEEGHEAAREMLAACILTKEYLLQGYLLRRLSMSGSEQDALRSETHHLYRTNNPSKKIDAASALISLIRDYPQRTHYSFLEWSCELVAQELEVLKAAAELLQRYSLSLGEKLLLRKS